MSPKAIATRLPFGGSESTPRQQPPITRSFLQTHPRSMQYNDRDARSAGEMFLAAFQEGRAQVTTGDHAFSSWNAPLQKRKINAT